MKTRIPQDEINRPHVVSTKVKDDTLILKCHFKDKNRNYRLPERLYINYSFLGDELIIKTSFDELTASKLITEIWTSSEVKDIKNVKIEKLGSKIDPKDVIQYGNKQLHAVEKVFTDEFDILNIDTPLVALGEMKCLELHSKFDKNYIHFNYFNNILNPNFPLWCERDIVSEFRYNIK